MTNAMETLTNLKAKFQSLDIGDSDTANTLLAQLRMYITTYFPNNFFHYLDSWNAIKFNCFRTRNLKVKSDIEQEKSWNASKEQVNTLLDIMMDNLQSKTTKPPIQVINMNKNTKVFIVHGRDDLAKEQVARFLENLGLEAIILHEQSDGGQTIIEKLESNTDVGFAVVLYTACDVGKYKDDESLQGRARQNVVFEHGYLIAKIGRKNVLALVKESVERPSDISGVVYTAMDSGGAWKTKLANELKSSNFDVDMNRI